MDPEDSCLICKRRNAKFITRCNHKYHKRCMYEMTDCFLCGSPVSNVQQLEDLMSEKITLDEIFDEDSTIMFDPEVMHWALQHYDLDLVYEIAKFDHGVDMEYYVSYAAEDGHLNMLKLIFETYDRRPGMEALGAAIKNGHFEVVKYLTGMDMNCDEHTVWSAVYSENLEMVMYFVGEMGVRCDYKSLETSAEKGLLEILVYLIEKGAPCSTNVVLKAAETGNYEMVEYLLSVEADFTASAIHIAASKGHHDIVQLLVEHAQVTGHLDTADYMKHLTICD